MSIPHRRIENHQVGIDGTDQPVQLDCVRCVVYKVRRVERAGERMEKFGGKEGNDAHGRGLASLALLGHQNGSLTQSSQLFCYVPHCLGHAHRR